MALKPENIYFDTGCHVTTISSDLADESPIKDASLPQDARRNLNTGGYAVIQVDSIFRLTGFDLELTFVARIVPRERMPN